MGHWGTGGGIYATGAKPSRSLKNVDQSWLRKNHWEEDKRCIASKTDLALVLDLQICRALSRLEVFVSDPLEKYIWGQAVDWKGSSRSALKGASKITNMISLLKLNW